MQIQHSARFAAGGARRGSNQTQVGIYNERLVLDCARRNNGAAAADIVRETGLSAQTVAGIVRRLLAAGLLEKQRRRANQGVGQPAVPLRLRAGGAYAIGVKIGRANAETMLTDFEGKALRSHQCRYDYPRAEKVLPWARRRIAAYGAALGADEARLAGAGVAAFFGFGGWSDVYPMPAAAIARWKKVNLAEALACAGADALLVNDATAACIAECELGGAMSGGNMLYIYLGAFVGGGVALNRQVFFGDNGNAGALASMPLGRGQMMKHASLHMLRHALAAAGCGAEEDSPAAQKIRARWRRDAAAALTAAVIGAVAVLDLGQVVIDGELSRAELEALTRAVRRGLTARRLQGLMRPQVRAGTLGARAGCLGAAWLPLYAKYSPAQALLLKRLPAVAVAAAEARAMAAAQ